MTVLPVAHYLRDLGGEQSSKTARGGAQGGTTSEIEDRIEDAYVRGVLEGRAAAQAEYGSKLERQSEAAEEHLKSERARWTADEGARLGAGLAKALGEVEARIAEHVACVLKPFLIERLRLKAVSELRSTLDALLIKGDYGKISVSGPEDLLGSLKEQLEGRTQAIHFTASEGTCDVCITADETILETRIGAWLEAIGGESS